MLVRKVFGKIFPKYQAALDQYPKCSIRSAIKYQKMEQNMQDIIELTAYPQRNKSIAEYIKTNPAIENIELNFRPSYSELLKTEPNNILSSCEDNPAKIKKLLGSYGLAKYAGVDPSKILGKSEYVHETGYALSGTISEEFDRYLMRNPQGYTQDIHERFGECGKVMEKSYYGMSFMRNGLGFKDGQLAETYSITDRFDVLEPFRVI